MADYVEENNLQRKLAFNLYVGASVGPEIEDRWAKLGMTLVKQKKEKINFLKSNVGHLSAEKKWQEK